MSDAVPALVSLVADLPWRWIYVVGWLATFLLTCYPMRGRELGQDDGVRAVLLFVLWIPFAVAVVHAARSRDGSGPTGPGASPTAGPGSGYRRRESD